MHYSLTLPGPAPWPIVSLGGALAETRAQDDPRWSALLHHLKVLRDRGRRAIRIVDVNCRDGALLIHAARRAHALGFLSIEGLGTDLDRGKIEEARWRSHLLHDTAIGLEFEVGDAVARLHSEAEFPADIVLYEASARDAQALRCAAERAGRLVLAEAGSEAKAHP